MALKPGSEQRGLSLPDDYQHDHTEERPEDWGWHGEWGRGARIGGWVTIIVLLLMMTASHSNNQGTLFLGITVGVLFVMLLRDRHQRKNAWRQ